MARAAAIKALEQKNAEQLDAAELAKTFAPDAVLLDYMSGGVYQGRAAIEKAASALLAPVKSISANIREQNIVTDGNFACNLLTTDFEFVTRDGMQLEAQHDVAIGKVMLAQLRDRPRNLVEIGGGAIGRAAADEGQQVAEENDLAGREDVRDFLDEPVHQREGEDCGIGVDNAPDSRPRRGGAPAPTIPGPTTPGPTTPGLGPGRGRGLNQFGLAL